METVTPEPRRLTAKGQATRERIVNAAAELIFTHGVAGTSIEEIRRAAAVSGSQMTHYFADKHALVRAVIAHQAASILAFHDDPQLGQFDSFAALRRWADLAIERQRRQNCVGGCRFGSLAGELAETDQDLRGELAKGFDRWEALLAGGIRLMRDRGELRPDADPGQLALSLLAAHQGGLLLTQVKRDPAPLEAALAGALDHVRSFAITTPKEHSR